MRRLSIVLLFLATSLFAQDDIPKKIDAIFANQVKPDTPGCAVGVGRNGEVLFERGYGLANLEYDIPITPSTIFEAGSVSKQFTAAAVMLLVDDGKLSLDDPVRKYVAELPDSAAAITVRQILTHTSGLRDWGTIVALSGWRRGTRLFSLTQILDVLSRQRELNFPPGTQWSYSNSGYNLAAILVERVSGKSFPDFTRERIFTPLGMSHSAWRDNYARVVKGRATAYDPDDKTFVADMDIENIYGNCCLLTTVGDLLKWNDNFRTTKVGSAKMLQAMQTTAILANGQKTDYGLGLFVGDDGGKREVWHSGATAGWRAFLSHRMEPDLSVAVLCNRGDAPTGSLVRKVAEVFGQAPPASPEPVKTTAKPALGLYRDPKTNAVIRISSKDDELHFGLRPGTGPTLVPIGENRYRLGSFNEVRFDNAGLHLITLHKPEALYVRITEVTPSSEQLAEYTGTYSSDEVGATYNISAENTQLMVKVTPVLKVKLDPIYADGFLSEYGDPVLFTRDASGRVNGFDVKADYAYTDGSARVERMHFVRK